MKSVAKKNVLITVCTMGQCPEMLRIADLLKTTSEFKPILYFNLGVNEANPYAAYCLQNGIDVLDYQFGYIEAKRVEKVEKPVKQIIQEQQLKIQIEKSPNIRLKYYIKHNFPALFKKIKSTIYTIYKNLHLLGLFYRIAIKLSRFRRETKFLKQYKIDLLIFAENSEDYFTPQLIRLAHSKNIKSVVFPYTFANQYEFLEDAWFNDRTANKTLLSWIVSRLFPKWTYEYKEKKLIKNNPSFILTSELFGDSPPNPWVMSSGFSDAIAVESSFMKEYYQKAGIPVEQMIETGYPSLDKLATVEKDKKNLKLRLANQLKINAEKSWIVCAVPPSQWPRAGVGFKSYNQFLDKFLNAFKNLSNIEVLFKFHPRLDANDVKNICEAYQINYVEQDTADLIGMADMYIASASSTIRWALALGIPTINYDLYGYRYGDFEEAKNCKTVEKFEEFEQVLSELSIKLTSRTGVDTFVKQSEYGLLDGKANSRILELFNKLTTNR